MGEAPTLLILAAGLGSRYGGLKQLEGFGPAGQAIIEYSVFDAARAGFGRVVAVVRPELEELFEEKLGARLRHLLPLAYAHQRADDLPGGRTPPPGRTKPWGTGHAVLAARAALRAAGAPFAVINADDFYGAPAYRALADFFAAQPDGSEQALVAYPLGPTLSPHGTVSRGVCEVSTDGRLRGITERTAIARAPDGAGVFRDPATGAEVLLPPETPVSLNFFGLRAGFLDFLEDRFAAFLERAGGDVKAEFYLPAAVSEGLAAGWPVRAAQADSPWFGVTNPADAPAVRAALAELHARGEYPAAF